MSLTVVKVGGSLYDHPRFAAGLRNWLATQRAPVLLVPGGGAFADAVRDLDTRHQLGEEASHWLALRAVTLAAHMLNAILPEAVLIQQPGQTFDIGLLDAFTFCRRDEGFSGSLPHSWEVSSDSLAIRVACVFRADSLILLKSISGTEPMNWMEAMQKGWVDHWFSTIVPEFDGKIAWKNFRSHLDSWVSSG